MMEATLQYQGSSLISNLNELETFVLHDPSAQHMYQQYLASVTPNGNKAHHIPFFADIVSLGERENRSKSRTTEDFRAELISVYEKYFLPESEMLLDIPHEWLEQVRNNMERHVTLVAFKPAIKAVIRDLAFVHLESFINSPLFKDFKDKVLTPASLVQEDNRLKTSPKEKESTHRLRKFFGDKLLHAGASGKKTLGRQPKHIKEYKLSKKFGERVGVEREKTSLIEECDVEEPPLDVDRLMAQMTTRRDRRLHVFFGDYFEIEETLFCERVRAMTETDLHEFRRQPTHVNSFRLARFFGVRPPIDADLFQQPETGSPCVGEGSKCECEGEGDDTSVDSNLHRHSKTHHLNRFFGERMDPAKEANSISFASQPENVKGCTLKKIFGESAAHTINFEGQLVGGTWPEGSRGIRSRAKVEKIFGPFEG